MSMTPQQITALTTELNNDPLALGYAQFIPSLDVDALIGVLTWIRDGATPCPTNNVVGAAITGVRQQSVKNSEISGVIANADFVASPSAALLAWYGGLMSMGTIVLTNADGSDNAAFKNLKALIQNPSTSRANLIALSTRNGSRIEQLLGVSGIVPTEGDVSKALGK